MRKINFRPIFYSFLSFILALVCARRIFQLNLIYIIFFALIIGAVVGLCIYYKKFKNLIILAVSFCVGIGTFYAGYNIFYCGYNGENVFVSGRVCSVTSYEKYSSVVLEEVKLNSKNKLFSICLYVNGETKIDLGDEISFESKLNKVLLFNEQFNSYYYKNNTSYKTYVKASDINIKSGNLKLDEKIRKSVNDFLCSHLTKDGSAIISAILFGDKTNLSPEIKNSYSENGIAHLLVISGLHIGFIVILCLFILDKLKIKKIISFIILFCVLLFYCYLCNFAPSVIRASIMSLSLYFANYLGEKYDRLNTLSLCGFAILLIKPLYIFNLGFLLSFCCVFSIFVLSPMFKKLLLKAKLNEKLSSTISVILGVQIGILPVTAIAYSEFNVLSILVNFICIPIFEIAFMLAVIFVPLCMLMPFLSFLLKFDEFIFYIITKIVFAFSNLAWLKINLVESNEIIVFSSYTIMFVVSGFVNLPKKTKLISCLTIGLIGVSFCCLTLL